MLRATILPTAVLLSVAHVFAAVPGGANKFRTTPIGASAAERTLLGTATSRAAQNSMTVGDKYAVKVTCGGVAQSYEGKLLKVSDRWIVLRRYDNYLPSSATLFGSLPVVGSWVRHACQRVGERDQWIPREAMTIESHNRGRKGVTIAHPLGDEPPLGNCTWLGRSGNVVAVEHGDLKAVKGDNFTVKAGDAAENRQQHVGRRDIFCVSLLSPCSDPNEKE